VNHNRIGLTALLVVVVGLGSPSQPAHAVPSVPPASVFTSDRDGDSELYYRARTGRVVQLTRNTADDFGAVHAPDGRRLAFASDRDGDDEIFTMEITGRHIRQLTDNTGARTTRRPGRRTARGSPFRGPSRTRSSPRSG